MSIYEYKDRLKNDSIFRDKLEVIIRLIKTN
jgi:hypothetical protein